MSYQKYRELTEKQLNGMNPINKTPEIHVDTAHVYAELVRAEADHRTARVQAITTLFTHAADHLSDRMKDQLIGELQKIAVAED